VREMLRAPGCHASAVNTVIAVKLFQPAFGILLSF
jgi:hypothetical protein